MKIVRYSSKHRTSYGVLEGKIIKDIDAPPFKGIKFTGRTHSLSEVKLLAPITPSKILAMARNYESHLGSAPKPSKPEPFFKTPSCIIGHSESIILPKDSGLVQEEAELVVVIGRRCKKATSSRALDYVLGYTCGNDVSAREWQRGDIQWWRAKSSDTFGPIGPYIETEVNYSNLEIWARINGKVVQHCNTSEMLFDVPALISFISRVITLEPGDLIFTGTSGVPAMIDDGDLVEVEIEGIGVLSNPVVRELP